MGVAEFTSISYNLNELLQSHDLEELGTEFTQEEMDSVIKSLRKNHAHRPDGFNGLFIKKCWNLIKPEFCHRTDQIIRVQV